MMSSVKFVFLVFIYAESYRSFPLKLNIVRRTYQSSKLNSNNVGIVLKWADYSIVISWTMNLGPWGVDA